MFSSSFKFSRSSSSSFSKSSVFLSTSDGSAASAATGAGVGSTGVGSSGVARAGLLLVEVGSTCVDRDCATADMVSLVAGDVDNCGYIGKLGKLFEMFTILEQCAGVNIITALRIKCDKYKLISFL